MDSSLLVATVLVDVESAALRGLCIGHARGRGRHRALFDDSVIDRHLDALAADQQDDGGWPIRWDPPGAAAVSEWRGKWTLDALLTLRAYGRL